VARTPTFFVLKYDAVPDELLVSEDLSWIEKHQWVPGEFMPGQAVVVLSGKCVFRFYDKEGYGYKTLEKRMLSPGDGLYGSRDNFPEANGNFNLKFKINGEDTHHKIKGVNTDSENANGRADYGFDVKEPWMLASLEDDTQVVCIYNNENAPHECYDSMYLPAGGSKTIDVEIGQLLCVMKGTCSFNGVAKESKDWIGVDENKPVVIESTDSCVIGAFKNSTPYSNWYI